MTDTTTLIAPSFAHPASWPRTIALVSLVVAIMTAVLGYMVWDRVSLLRNGREIVLPVTPVDPRSLFRGDYVILGYPITRVPMPDNQGQPISAGAKIYVTLAPEPDGTWKVTGSSLNHPGAAQGDTIILQGRSEQRPWQRADGNISVRYGIESFFVPEDTGRDLENLVRDKKIAARVAVDAKGRAAIKGLLADGKPLVDTPFW